MSAKTTFFEGHHFALAGFNPSYRGTDTNHPKFYGVQYNHCGKLRLRIDGGKEHTVEGPYVFITHPGHLFEYGPVDNEPRSHNFICSNGPRIERYIETGLLPIDNDPPLIKIHSPERFLQLMHCIASIVDQVGSNHDRAVLLFEELLLMLHEENPDSLRLPAHQEPFFTDLIARIKAEPHKNWDFAKSARKINVTQPHFRRLFRQLAGIAPQQFLIQCRLHNAAEMLITGKEQISEIASKSGIENEFYFSRLFKNKYHISPMGYRKEFTGKV